MGKKTIENVDYSNGDYAELSGAEGSPNHQANAATYADVVMDNQKLRQTVQNLETKLAEEKKEAKQRYEEMLQAISQLAKQVNSITEHNGSSVENDHNSIDDIAELTGKLSCELTDLDLKFQLHENSTQDGHLIWKINDFVNRKNDAMIGRIRALHSAPCYTEKYGYKFCLRLYLHGDGMGRGTHLSLFLVIMKSEYDDILQWPFQKHITFTLINQHDRSKDHVEKMFPVKDSSSFQKPKKDMNIASGCPLFISLDRLEPEGFLGNGNLFIEVKID